MKKLALMALFLSLNAFAGDQTLTVPAHCTSNFYKMVKGKKVAFRMSWDFSLNSIDQLIAYPNFITSRMSHGKRLDIHIENTKPGFGSDQENIAYDADKKVLTMTNAPSKYEIRATLFFTGNNPTFFTEILTFVGPNTIAALTGNRNAPAVDVHMSCDPHGPTITGIIPSIEVHSANY